MGSKGSSNGIHVHRGMLSVASYGEVKLVWKDDEDWYGNRLFGRESGWWRWSYGNEVTSISRPSRGQRVGDKESGIKSREQKRRRLGGVQHPGEINEV